MTVVNLADIHLPALGWDVSLRMVCLLLVCLFCSSPPFAPFIDGTAGVTIYGAVG